MSEPPLLAGEGLCREYEGGSVHALQEVSLAVNAGEALAIMGPSGSGKSTLLALLGVLDTPTRGTVRIRGVAVGPRTDRATLRAHTLGFVFQQHHMIPALTLAENVAIPLIAQGRSVHDRHRRALAALDRVGLAHRADHLPTRVSGGERQRAAVARALAGEPDILLADEPTGSVDHAVGAGILDLLLAPVHAGAAALVVVTHDPDVAARADRILRLRDGRVAPNDAD